MQRTIYAAGIYLGGGGHLFYYLWVSSLRLLWHTKMQIPGTVCVNQHNNNPDSNSDIWRSYKTLTVLYCTALLQIKLPVCKTVQNTEH